MDAVARRFEAGAQGRDGRALAVGAGDMDDRREPVLRVAQRGEQALDAAERQVDLFRVQAAEPGQHKLGGGRLAAHAGAAGAAIGSRSNFRMRAKVAVSSPRGTTMSTMPCSKRYSAR